MSRIPRAAGRKLLIPYLVAGDPDLAASLSLMHELARQGADVIELGVPFSDPSSDGPAIQRGTERALAGGVRLRDVLELAAEFRRRDADTPVVLMGYLNPIEAMGCERFAREAARAGVDGALVVDMPPAESEILHPHLRAAGLDTIYLVAPTTGAERARAIAARCSGYLYYVSLRGVTGAAITDRAEVAEKVGALRALTELPVVVGFGIKDAEGAAAMAALADGVVIGSALVEAIGALPPGGARDGPALAAACAVVGAARKAIDSVAPAAV